MNQTLKEQIFSVADKLEEYSLYAIIFYIPISIALVESFVGFALLGFIVKKSISPDFTFIKSRFHFLLLLFFIFCGLSLLNSGIYIDKSFRALFFKWGQYILIFLMVQDALACPERIRNAMRFFLFVGCLVAIDGIFQYFCGWEFLRGRPVMLEGNSVKAMTGPFTHYNNFAVYLMCIITFYTVVILDKNNDPRFRGNNNGCVAGMTRRVYYGGAFLVLWMLLGCLLLTFSRGGWVGLLLASLLMLFLSFKRKFIIALLVLFILAALLIPIIRERVLFTFALNGDSDRFVIWKGAWGMIKTHPFLGGGVGTFMGRFSQFTKGLGVQYAHNCYLQIWAETGVFALISFIGFVSLLLWQGVLLFRRSQDHIVLGLICAVFGFLVHSFFDTHLYSVQLAVLFWFLAGMLAAVVNQ